MVMAHGCGCWRRVPLCLLLFVVVVWLNICALAFLCIDLCSENSKCTRVYVLFHVVNLGCLRWDPRERFTPEDCMKHEWILEALLPPTFRSHVSQPFGDSGNRSVRKRRCV